MQEEDGVRDLNLAARARAALPFERVKDARRLRRRDTEGERARLEAPVVAMREVASAVEKDA